jgi:glutathione S-transferase
MKLYYSSASPYARKAWIIAIEAGVGDAVENVAMAVTPHAPNAAFARENPLMKIPTLVRDDGTHLYDSAVICEYLDALGGGRLFPAAGEARWQALRRHALADGIMDAALVVRYETTLRPEALRWQAWIDGQYAKIDYALDAFEQEVDGFGEAFVIDHVALVAALGYLDFRFAGRPWRPGRPKVERWFAGVGKRASVAHTQPS